MKIIKTDIYKPRRKYYSIGSANYCPECNSKLVEQNCKILLAVKSSEDEAEYIANDSGSSFCKNCPVVVFDKNKISQTAKFAIKRGKNIQYIILGLANLDAIPEEKKHLPIGDDDNPVPLVDFLPDLNNKTIVQEKKIGRNEPCTCGSGKKYKKCCGK